MGLASPPPAAKLPEPPPQSSLRSFLPRASVAPSTGEAVIRVNTCMSRAPATVRLSGGVPHNLAGGNPPHQEEEATWWSVVRDQSSAHVPLRNYRGSAPPPVAKPLKPPPSTSLRSCAVIGAQRPLHEQSSDPCQYLYEPGTRNRPLVRRRSAQPCGWQPPS